ncbi:MAG: hypothetical protein IKX40_12140, partial [Thermoguttaceae bacterium]|nr:hypothetical protein [Thermoguttaceae bacterium]
VSVEENPIKKAATLVDSKIAPQAEPDFFINLQKRAYIPNDPLFENQWHLNNDGTNSSVSGSDHAHVAEAWEVMQTVTLSARVESACDYLGKTVTVPAPEGTTYKLKLSTKVLYLVTP